MKLEKTREALSALAQVAFRHYEGAPQEHVVESLRDDAYSEVAQAESLLRDAATLRVFAVAGLSAFHGKLCSGVGGAGVTEDVHTCSDPTCLAWAAALAKEGV